MSRGDTGTLSEREMAEAQAAASEGARAPMPGPRRRRPRPRKSRRKRAVTPGPSGMHSAGGLRAVIRGGGGEGGAVAWTLREGSRLQPGRRFAPEPTRPAPGRRPPAPDPESQCLLLRPPGRGVCLGHQVSPDLGSGTLATSLLLRTAGRQGQRAFLAYGARGFSQKLVWEQSDTLLART